MATGVRVVQALGQFRVGKVSQGFLIEFQFAECLDLFHDLTSFIGMFAIR